MRVVVSGGSGLLGTHLKMIKPDWTYLSSEDCDLRDSEDTKYVFNFLKPDVVIHLAAKVGGLEYNIANQPELLADNLSINTNTINSALKNNARIITMLSTCIYPDKSENYPMTEEQINQGNPPESNKGYAIAKRVMYEHIQLLNKKYNTNHICIVPSNMYGCSKKDIFSDDAHFVPSLIRKIFELNNHNEILKSGRLLTQLRLIGDGSPLRQFTYAGDVASIIPLAVEKEDFPSVLNIATPENLSIKEMAETALEVLAADYYDIVWDTSKPNGQYRKDVTNTNLEKYYLNSFGMGVAPRFTSFRRGIKKVYDFISNN